MVASATNKIIMKTFIALIFTLLLSHVNAQEAKAERNVTAVKFADTKILLNEIHCYNYIKNGNDFTITDLSKKELISGHIQRNFEGAFESLIDFKIIGQKFTNKTIVGRNDLIFRLVNYDVFKKDCAIDVAKLKAFVAEFNQLK
jgi:hypothetical protein